MPPRFKTFVDRLNHCLDDLGAPAQTKERAVVLSKMLEIPRQQAWALLEGNQAPDQEFLMQIARELEVDPKWLAGE